MGTSQYEVSNIGTVKGQGYRIISIKPNSPLDSFVDPYFDFIIDAVPAKQPQRNPKQILQKLTNNNKPAKIAKKLQEIWTENQNHVVTLKIVSTKYRNVKTLQVTPNRNWNGSQDLMGIQTRLQRYDEAFQTYFPISDIRQGSPVKKANIKQGEYLIACKQFKYASINEMLQNIYQVFYDKSIQNKTIHLVVYGLAKDELRVVPVTLARGWGDKGLLGCQFLQGHLNKFPKNLLQVRQEIKLKKKNSDQGQKIKKQLTQLNGASVLLMQSLKSQKTKKKKVAQLKSIISIPLPSIIHQQKQIKNKDKKNQNGRQYQSQIIMVNSKYEGQSKIQSSSYPQQFVSIQKYNRLEKRVYLLQQTINNIKRYVQNIEQDEEKEEV